LFHANAEKVLVPFDIGKARDTFNEIRLVVEDVSEKLGVQFSDIVHKSIEWSDGFLEQHTNRMQQRVSQGFKRDVHGDLHSRNVFLYRNPVLFDCIEFNDEFRQIDVLYEIAFLCMDFERYGHDHLTKIFLTEYATYFPSFQKPEDYSLFKYFKCLRANIRAKVHGMQLRQAENGREVAAQISETRKYLSLMNQYIAGS
jgi:aminoglycoside phosphotransferase family enzyme